ncbi:spermidine N(1)-acetyltransferase [Colletotrichum liriopes]|uniref:Spermidine N(1)-acetyltransferase n=1 Tax=Colletotrichum liriopes TaxID=708192 RepID=A0AA37LYH8_9PEZI|nr:spermidine N(1)-acetyltransferase [Colletotrichum liriopes]
MAIGLGNAFRSKRLEFRAIEDNDEDKSWFHEQIKSDPVGFAMGDPNVLRPQTRKRNDTLLQEIQKSLLGVVISVLATDDTVTSQPIGVLVLNDEAGDNYRHHHRLAFLTISIASAHRNKGYGAEAINWAVDWAFQRANIHSIRLGCVEYNERGRHLYEILGFVLEGRLRKSHYHERKWWDVLLYSMLEDEWLALRGLEDKEVARNR